MLASTQQRIKRFNYKATRKRSIQKNITRWSFESWMV